MRDRKTATDDAALWDKIRALGEELGGDAIPSAFALIGPLHPTAPDPDVTLTVDISYGPHARNRLDVYQPKARGAGKLPVLLFIHGGGFTAGDKRNGPFFGNLGNWAARNGMIGVMMTYRLAPEAQWPSGEEDLRDAIAWTRREIAAFGGDPDYIVLMGHSAGAGISAGYLSHPAQQPASGPGLRGAILNSGLYNLVTGRDLAGRAITSYYGEDSSRHLAQSSTPTIKGVSTRIAVLIAENESATLHAQAYEMVSALFERDGRMPRFAKLHTHNHYTEILSAGLPSAAELERNIYDFVFFDCAAKN